MILIAIQVLVVDKMRAPRSLSYIYQEFQPSFEKLNVAMYITLIALKKLKAVLKSSSCFTNPTMGYITIGGVIRSVKSQYNNSRLTRQKVWL